MDYYISFDVGGTTIKYAIVDSEGHISDRDAFNTVDDSTFLVNKMQQIVDELKQRHVISGIGISAPGIVRKDGYMVTGGAIHQFDGYPLAENLHQMTQLPVTVENDANAATIAERWQGSAIDCENYITIVLGTGVGGGIVINGQVYRGAHGMAGELGWAIAHDPDSTRPLEEFSFNQHAAVVSGLVNRFNQSHTQVESSWQPIVDARQIFSAEEDGDVIAQACVRSYLNDVATMIINLFADFDPELIVIGGGISANQAFMARLQQTIAQFITRHESMNRIRDLALGHVVTAGLKNDAGLIGAAYQIREKLNKEQ